MSLGDNLLMQQSPFKSVRIRLGNSSREDLQKYYSNFMEGVKQMAEEDGVSFDKVWAESLKNGFIIKKETGKKIVFAHKSTPARSIVYFNEYDSFLEITFIFATNIDSGSTLNTLSRAFGGGKKEKEAQMFLTLMRSYIENYLEIKMEDKR